MERLGEYVLSLTATAMICCVVLSLFQEGSLRNLLRMVCGVILTLSALSPLTELTFPDLSTFSDSYWEDGEAISAMGTDMAAEQTSERIQRQLEAYILDKAAALDAEIRPVMELNEQGIPVSVRICGSCSDSVRRSLTAVITNDLGIPEEDQEWTGEM